jgi:hypothetical protein
MTYTVKAFNLRGTNGSGKTYVARALLAASKAKPKIFVKPGKPLLYQGVLFERPFIVFGSYETQCGGCDTIPSVKLVADLLKTHMMVAEEGTIFYEGLMISHMIGTVGAAAKMFNDNHVMGFLDTPLETCIERVKARRLEKGNTIPFDPNKTLVGDYRAVQGAKRNAITQGFNVRTIDHTCAVEDVMHELERLHR